MKENVNEEYKQIKLISQGTYGCIFKKGLTCDGMVDESETISKIQEKNETSENEINIGKKIMSIPNYKDHFAPIIESCQIDIGKIDTSEINKCNFIKNHQNKNQSLNFQMNKIQYVGKKDLGSYFLNLLENKQNIEKFSSEFINIFLEIVNKYRILNEENNIIHMDVKTNNIMINDMKEPIIIDFGLSFDKKLLDEDKDMLEFVFFADAPTYAYWCFDIYVINYAISAILLDTKTNEIRDLPVNMEQIKECTNIYFEKNEGLDKVLTTEEIKEMKQTHLNYLKDICNLHDESAVNDIMWKQIIDKLIDNALSWDIYGLCICYLEFFDKLQLTKCEEQTQYLCSFKKLLNVYVKSTPDKRISKANMIEQINNEIQQVSKEEQKRIKSVLTTFFENSENFIERRNTVKAYIDKVKETTKKLQNQKDSNRN
jgi:serine/threonine protein kinase